MFEGALFQLSLQNSLMTQNINILLLLLLLSSHGPEECFWSGRQFFLWVFKFTISWWLWLESFWSLPHSHKWQLMLTATWNLNDDCQLKYYEKASQCVLGFLTEWQLISSSSYCPMRKTSRNFILLSNIWTLIKNITYSWTLYNITYTICNITSSGQ